VHELVFNTGVRLGKREEGEGGGGNTAQVKKEALQKYVPENVVHRHKRHRSCAL
jgi:hypothetical protein